MAPLRAKNKQKPSRVLIARFSAIGDVAMSIPVVYEACRANPDVDFVMVTRPSMAAMMVNAPDNLAVEGVDVKSDYTGPLGMRRLVADLSKRYGAFDAFADLHNVLRTRLMALWSGLNGTRVVTLDKNRSGRRQLTRRHDKLMLPLVHQAMRYREVFERLGLEMPAAGSPEGFTSLFAGGKAPAEDFAAVTAQKQPGEVWIGIAPFAAHKGKIYPLELMERVVDSLLELPSTRIFLFGAGEQERGVLATWAAKSDRVTSMAEKRHGFATELALLSHLDVMVSMDSANMHLASLVNVPVVSVWGATHPYCGFTGRGQSDETAVQLTMTCRPCSVFGNKPCHRGDYHCLAGIAPTTIVDHVKKIIDNE